MGWLSFTMPDRFLGGLNIDGFLHPCDFGTLHQVQRILQQLSSKSLSRSGAAQELSPLQKL
jgi:hypothetical protein